MTTIDWDGNGGITDLPSALTKLTNLHHLWLGGVDLATLPSWFGELVHLQTLDLTWNPSLGDLAIFHEA